MKFLPRSRSYLFALLCLASAASAQTTFQGSDPGVAAGGARPNSDAAASSFYSAARAFAQVTTMNFESLITGPMVAGGLQAGVTLSSVGQDVACLSQGIDATDDTTTGYNTTSGGTKHLGFCPVFDVGTSSMTFEFAQPVSGFGTYITGLGTAAGNLAIRFSDGTSQNYSVTGSANGGAQFFGVTDAGRFISSATFELTGLTGGTRDIFGLDDFSIVVQIRQVPTLDPLLLVLVSLLLAFAAAFRMRRR